MASESEVYSPDGGDSFRRASGASDAGTDTDTSAPPPLAPVPPRPAPTVYVTYGARSVKARIDREVPLDEIIAQLVNSQQLAVAEPPALFALREKESGSLVTEENLDRFLDRGAASFALGPSPVIEAVEVVDKLRSSDTAAVKLATFSLRTLIKEPAFLTAFINRGGMGAIQDVIKGSTGNTLAYALLSSQQLLELDARGSHSLGKDFIAKLVQIIATEPLINILRPATQLLRLLSDQGRPSAATPRLDASAGVFAIAFELIQQRIDFLPIVVGRLYGNDWPLALANLELINSLFQGATEMGDERFHVELETLGTSKIVANLLDTWKEEAYIAAILGYQANVVAALHAQLVTPVDEAHYGLFDDIWTASGSDENTVDEATKWQSLGFGTEEPQTEFKASGLLGLKTLLAFAFDRKNEFASTLKNTLARPAPRRCPLAAVSTAVVLALANHFQISDDQQATRSTTLNPYVLQFNQCHALATRFSVRMWTELGATEADFERVATLMKSQIAHVLTIDGSGGKEIKSWDRIRVQFLKADYRSVRDRQVRELETGDDLHSKAPVRHLRGRLYLESFEFVRNQRIACLHEGAWFRVPTPAGTTNGPSASGLKKQVKELVSPTAPSVVQKWKFCRLAANKKALHYLETNGRIAIAPGLDDLPERIMIALISNISPYAPSGELKRQAPSIVSTANTASTGSSQPLTITLRSSDGIIAELVAPNEMTYFEWLDGLSLLRPDGGIVTSQTADYVQALTDIGVKIKLLDLSGEKVDIPNVIDVRQVPAYDGAASFYYSENL
ncbi:hypothetical protein MVLG_03996 [Microbotryum lychnidis-dioicae p1A1 Lamole]|uniref:ELMO domain-containing protein n=2 Tax=Microbotryum lychnidis-dioicae (strain p1A1 Lamole / MvSl-1064) TaxID=683840 RepID=U5H9V8_USTV1|nr:hypothetical protein MVLG_03996 [Microbotryum lychnidis-dioicae p1A1 Lamole]|eukprot:KDE05624.1 hypothetical protein MVLG_03996 [Microbotryum lychnidis-dioicae p1A1 Lamole]